MPLGFRSAARSDLGTIRSNNEDAAYASSEILVLTDGMGGHAGGEVASVVTLHRFAAINSGGDVPAEITEAGRDARTALNAMSMADPSLETMGTTAVTLITNGEQLTAGHIGDSRMYVVRGDALYQVTTDHTHVQQLVESGRLRPDQVAAHPYRAMLLRSLDDQPDGSDLDLISVDITSGDRILLCSDGLSDYVDPERIGPVLVSGDVAHAADALIAAALDASTRDNVTVVVADVVDDPVDQPATAVGAAGGSLSLSEEAAAALITVLPDFAAVMAGLPDPDREADDDRLSPAEPAGDQGIGDPLGHRSTTAATTAIPAEPEPDSQESTPPTAAAETDPAEPSSPYASTSPAAPSPPTAPSSPPQPTPSTEPPPESERSGVPLPAVLAALAVLLVGASFVFLL